MEPAPQTFLIPRAIGIEPPDPLMALCRDLRLTVMPEHGAGIFSVPGKDKPGILDFRSRIPMERTRLAYSPIILTLIRARPTKQTTGARFPIPFPERRRPPTPSPSTNPA